jgi:hypothetical protein
MLITNVYDPSKHAGTCCNMVTVRMQSMRALMLVHVCCKSTPLLLMHQAQLSNKAQAPIPQPATNHHMHCQLLLLLLVAAHLSMMANSLWMYKAR